MRLKRIGNNAPVVSSCRAESQAYVRELKDAHERTKQELRFEKDKNAMLVSKALELEREKNALLATHSTVTAPSGALRVSCPRRTLLDARAHAQRCCYSGLS